MFYYVIAKMIEIIQNINKEIENKIQKKKFN